MQEESVSGTGIRIAIEFTFMIFEVSSSDPITRLALSIPLESSDPLLGRSPNLNRPSCCVRLAQGPKKSNFFSVCEATLCFDT